MNADVCPETNAVMQSAWAACLSWSVRSKDPDFLAAFEEATGIKFPPPPKNALEAMIDEATGASVQILGQYIVWFNENVWGKYPGQGSEEQKP